MLTSNTITLDEPKSLNAAAQERKALGYKDWIEQGKIFSDTCISFYLCLTKPSINLMIDDSSRGKV